MTEMIPIYGLTCEKYMKTRVKRIRPGSGGVELLQNVPDWCVMPIFFLFLVMTDRYGDDRGDVRERAFSDGGTFFCFWALVKRLKSL